MRFPVSQEKERSLLTRMGDLGLHEADLEEEFVRSQGPGGQNVNKLATCVVLTHRPTGLQVRCQKERSQAMNRFFARRLLVEKMGKRLYGIRRAEEEKRYRIRKQKQRRGRRLKAKLRREKEMRRERKTLREPVKGEEFP